MKREYKVERISSCLETYLNEKACQGWRCVSVMPATEPHLEWTKIAVFERIVDDLDEDANNDIAVREEDISNISMFNTFNFLYNSSSFFKIYI